MKKIQLENEKLKIEIEKIKKNNDEKNKKEELNSKIKQEEERINKIKFKMFERQKKLREKEKRPFNKKKVKNIILDEEEEEEEEKDEIEEIESINENKKIKYVSWKQKLKELSLMNNYKRNIVSESSSRTIREMKDKKKKSLSFEVVEVYFKSLFCDQFPISKEFLQFLKEKKVGLKWDEWRMFLDFLQNQGNSFPKDYNEAEYYPVLIDEFYRWYCKKHNIKIPDPDEEGF
jgi:hypothetical protein